MLATSLTGKIHFLLDNVLNNDCQNVACPDNTLAVQCAPLVQLAAAVLTEHQQLYAARPDNTLAVQSAPLVQLAAAVLTEHPQLYAARPDNTLAVQSAPLVQLAAAVLTEHPQLYAARRRASLVLGDALVDARVGDPDGGELEGPRPLHAVPRPVGRQRLAVLPPRDARLRQAERLALEGGARVDGGGHLRQAVLDGRRHCVKGEVGRGGRVETGRDC